MPGGGTDRHPDDVFQDPPEANYDESLPDKIVSWLDDAEKKSNSKKLTPIATMCEKECKLAKCETTIKELLKLLIAYDFEMAGDAQIQDCIQRLGKLIEL